MENWQDFIPRGKRTELAKAYQLSKAAVSKAIRMEDVINYPELIEDARTAAFKSIADCKKHTEAVSKTLLP